MKYVCFRFRKPDDEHKSKNNGRTGRLLILGGTSSFFLPLVVMKKSFTFKLFPVPHDAIFCL